MSRFVWAALAALLCSVCAADTLYVTEFTAAPPDSVYYQAARTPALANQALAISGTSNPSAAFTSSTGLIRVHTDVACHVVIGTGTPVATTTDMRLGAGQTEYFVVPTGYRIAVILDPTP